MAQQLQSTTRMTTFKTLADTGALGQVLVRLMMAINDFGLANEALGGWMKEQPPKLVGRQPGAKMYFVRLIISHVFEALDVIKDMRDTPAMKAEVDKCDDEVKTAFAAVAAFIDTDDHKMMLRIRNDTAFHYGEGIVSKALTAAAREHPNANLTMQLGKKAIDWHFEPGDRIIDRIVVREIFKIPPEVKTEEAVNKEVTKVVDRMHTMAEKVADFAGYFIWHHASKS